MKTTFYPASSIDQNGLEKAIHALEQRLVGRIEEIEGRVPCDTEVRLHGLRKCNPTKAEITYCWKGQPIIAIACCSGGYIVGEPK